MLNCKADFPLLRHHASLTFLDSAASSQKPQCVIDAIAHYYQEDHANIHRGIYALSARATQCFEEAREKIKTFIHARHAREIVFVRGATEGINLVADCFGRAFVKAGDEIILSEMEHHSNIVPWQMLCERLGATLKIIPVLDNGELDIAAYAALFSSRTKIVAVTHASNVLGTLNPIQSMARIAHGYQVPILVDGAQAFPHVPVDVQALECDFYVFSSHKAYGPTGVGILYGTEEWFTRLPPYHGGGNMIESVSFQRTTYRDIPYKFEAGTPNIADVIGFAVALDYLNRLGMDQIVAHEKALLKEAILKLSAVPRLKLLGWAAERVGVISFVLEGVHAHDVGTILDHHQIAVRVGHHCAMPLLARFQLPACVRVSLGVYNEMRDIDVLTQGLCAVSEVFA